ncbi:MAG TPA: enoyl-CoA hydratase/isomerase family protein [Firmicutes bacterium]|nr:enoyl-CoA hydratase/isomerase family protein [Bacillota bacterium]
MAIILETEGAIGIVRLASPPLNLLSNKAKDELESVLDTLGGREDLRAVVVVGEGEKAFCAGADLKEFPERIRLGMAGSVWDQGHRMSERLSSLPQVTIAALNGVAFGGGLEVALACDMIIAGPAVRLGLPEVKRGIMPGNGGIQKLIERVGRHKAIEYLVTGKTVLAEEALKDGLVDRVASEPLQAAMELAREICSLPGVAVTAIKRVVLTYMANGYSSYYSTGREWFELLHQTEDCREALQAFFEKREPHFSHRR